MAGMNQEQLTAFLQQEFPDVCTACPEQSNIPCFEIPVNQLYRVVSGLFKHQEQAYTFLTDLCGIHYPEAKGRELAVVYHLHNLKSNSRLKLKVFCSIDKPEIPSITGIFAGANWMERETYDFYGIRFLGHPDLRRILNMDEMVAFPLRKEYPLEDPTREDKADFHFGR